MIIEFSTLWTTTRSVVLLQTLEFCAVISHQMHRFPFPIKWLLSFHFLITYQTNRNLIYVSFFLLAVVACYYPRSLIGLCCYFVDHVIGSHFGLYLSLVKLPLLFLKSSISLQEQDGQCSKCQCSGNIDLGSSGNCNTTTGECLKCLYNTTGFNCQWCAPEYHGNALNKTCTSKCDRIHWIICTAERNKHKHMAKRSLKNIQGFNGIWTSCRPRYQCDALSTEL